MNEHYVCKSCGGASDIPGACSADGCVSNGQPLENCDCGDKEAHRQEESSSPATDDDSDIES